MFFFYTKILYYGLNEKTNGYITKTIKKRLGLNHGRVLRLIGEGYDASSRFFSMHIEGDLAIYVTSNKTPP